ncbi:MAG: Fic family protein [Proteobacteria bacterium]|nr:Fic family protein [Pseudomonadota bacterium]
MYLWENTGWPTFTWDESILSPLVAKVSYAQGHLLGKMEALGFDLRNEAQLQTLTEDVIKSSEIEGENLERRQVRSSVARRLGIDVGGTYQVDRHVEGIVEMMLDASGNYSQSLTMERLYSWHAALFPTGRSGMSKIRVAEWRDDSNGPMQVVSGPVGRGKVHFQAMPATGLPQEMAAFLDWVEQSSNLNPLLKAGLAHLWFITIHPFDDGNGRIARALTDMLLARSEKSTQRFYSMSTQIQVERNDYYTNLEWSQKGGLDVTRWLEWFLGCLLSAIEDAQRVLAEILAKAHFWERFSKHPLSERQIKVLNRLLDGFEGKLTTSKWAKLAKCSVDTAHRDIVDLIGRGALQKDPGGGRSTSYSLVY